jgi:hypothetical protein
MSEPAQSACMGACCGGALVQGGRCRGTGQLQLCVRCFGMVGTRGGGQGGEGRLGVSYTVTALPNSTHCSGAMGGCRIAIVLQSRDKGCIPVVLLVSGGLRGILFLVPKSYQGYGVYGWVSVLRKVGFDALAGQCSHCEEGRGRRGRGKGAGSGVHTQCRSVCTQLDVLTH